jgi:hypothetical protein
MKRGYEIWVAEAGFGSRLVCEDSDDESAIRAEVKAKVDAVLAGEPFHPELRPADLDALACVLWVPAQENAWVGYAVQDDLPSQPLRALAEAAVADLGRSEVPLGAPDR